MYLAAGMAHAVSAFTVAAMLAIWMKARERWTIRGAVALGAIGGLITMVREQDAVLLAGPLADYLIAVVAGPASAASSRGTSSRSPPPGFPRSPSSTSPKSLRTWR